MNKFKVGDYVKVKIEYKSFKEKIGVIESIDFDHHFIYMIYFSNNNKLRFSSDELELITDKNIIYNFEKLRVFK